MITFKVLVKVLGIFFLIAFSSCDFTTTEKKDPIFKISQDSVVTLLENYIVSERIDLSGQQIITNTTSTAQIELSVINNKGIPKKDSELAKLAFEIASILKYNLLDSNSYDTYVVIFVDEVVKGIKIEKKWKKYEFKKEVL